MTLAERKVKLENALEEIKRQMSDCGHDYGEAKYDEVTINEVYGFIAHVHGDDPYLTTSGTVKMTRMRWSKTCKICGEVIYTTNVVPGTYDPLF